MVSRGPPGGTCTLCWAQPEVICGTGENQQRSTFQVPGNNGFLREAGDIRNRLADEQRERANRPTAKRGHRDPLSRAWSCASNTAKQQPLQGTAVTVAGTAALPSVPALKGLQETNKEMQERQEHYVKIKGVSLTFKCHIHVPGFSLILSPRGLGKQPRTRSELP